MRFYLDEDQSPVTARTARDRHNLDVLSSHELGMDGATDEEQLLQAGKDGRCMITKNGDDFIALTESFERDRLPHAGVLIIPSSVGNDAYARIARALAWYHVLYPEGVPPYFVSYLNDPPDDRS